MQLLPGRLPRWRAAWLLVGRPFVVIPLAALVLVALLRRTYDPAVSVVLLLGLFGWAAYREIAAGRRVTGRYRPQLRVLVDAVAKEIGAPPPRRIGVTRRPVLRTDGPGSIVVGEPLLDRLTIEELRSLLAHELSVQARPPLQVLLHRMWVRAITLVDPGGYARRVVRELDEFSAAVEEYADHAAGHVTDPDTAARAVARAWLLTTAGQMRVRTVEWSPALAQRLSRRHPDLTEPLLALVGTELTTARSEPVPAGAR